MYSNMNKYATIFEMKKVSARTLVYCITLILILLLSFYIVINLCNNNYHNVLPKQVYRSAQLNQSTLLSYIKRDKIRTIINLRGKNPNASWYQNEIAAAKKADIQHDDITLSAHQLPSDTQLKRLVQLIETAKKPLLIHCRRGADRSGLAAAISVILSGDKSVDDLEDQISWHYNAISPTTVGYQVFQNYFLWIKKYHKDFGKTSFIQWVNSTPKLIAHQGWYLT